MKINIGILVILISLLFGIFNLTTACYILLGIGCFQLNQYWDIRK